jgi:hypothetical protein
LIFHFTQGCPKGSLDTYRLQTAYSLRHLTRHLKTPIQAYSDEYAIA